MAEVQSAMLTGARRDSGVAARRGPGRACAVAPRRLTRAQLLALNLSTRWEPLSPSGCAHASSAGAAGPAGAGRGDEPWCSRAHAASAVRPAAVTELT